MYGFESTAGFTPNEMPMDRNFHGPFTVSLFLDFQNQFHIHDSTSRLRIVVNRNGSSPKKIFPFLAGRLYRVRRRRDPSVVIVRSKKATYTCRSMSRSHCSALEKEPFPKTTVRLVAKAIVASRPSRRARLKSYLSRKSRGFRIPFPRIRYSTILFYASI